MLSGLPEYETIVFFILFLLADININRRVLSLYFDSESLTFDVEFSIKLLIITSFIRAHEAIFESSNSYYGRVRC